METLQNLPIISEIKNLFLEINIELNQEDCDWNEIQGLLSSLLGFVRTEESVTSMEDGDIGTLLYNLKQRLLLYPNRGELKEIVQLINQIQIDAEDRVE